MDGIHFDEARTGVIVWPSSTEKVTLGRLGFISRKYYSWISTFCYFFNSTDMPSILWLSRCCDAIVMGEGFLEVDTVNVIYEERQTFQQILIFSLGELGVACNKCGLAHRITNLRNATVDTSIFNKTLVCAAKNMDWYFTVEFFDAMAPKAGRATGGFEYMLMEDVRSRLGFEYTVQSVGLGEKWGTIKNGSWDGPLSLLSERKAQFALGDLTILHPRNSYFDYTYPHDFDVLALVSEPEARVFSSSVFLQLMDTGSWLSLFLLALKTCAVLAAGRKDDRSRTAVQSVIFRGLEFIFAALVQPSMAFPYETRSAVRGLLLIWTTGLFVLGKALSACLVMFIATPGFEWIIDTMNQCVSFLLTHPDARLCMSDGNYQNFFDPSSDVAMSWEAAQMTGYVYHECLTWSKQRTVNEVSQGKHTLLISEKVHLMAELMSAALKGGQSPTTHVSREHLNIMHQGILLQRGCAFSRVWQKLTRILFETGHIIHYKRTLNMFDLPPAIVEHTFSPLGLSSIGDFVAGILALETVMILVLLIEFIPSLAARIRRTSPLEAEGSGSIESSPLNADSMSLSATSPK